MSCQPGFSTVDLRFDLTFCDQDNLSYAGHALGTLTCIQAHTQDKDHMVTDLLTMISATSAFSTVGQQMLLDNGWLSNTATVRGQTHGPIRINSPPPFAAVETIRVTMLKVIWHTQYTQLGPFSSSSLSRKLCIFLSAYIPRFSVRCCCNVKVCFWHSSYWHTLIHTGESISKPVECCLRRMMAGESFMIFCVLW